MLGGDIFRSRSTPYRYYRVVSVGRVKVTVWEYFPYPLTSSRPNASSPRREPFKMTKRTDDTLSYGYEYYDRWEQPTYKEGTFAEFIALIVGGSTVIAGLFILCCYLLVRWQDMI